MGWDEYVKVAALLCPRVEGGPFAEWGIDTGGKTTKRVKLLIKRARRLISCS